MSGSARRLGLLAVALVVMGGALWALLARDAGPSKMSLPPTSCGPNETASQVSDVEGLTQQLVLLGVRHAACRLGIGTEQLVDDLGSGALDDAEVEAMRDGLIDAVADLSTDGALPQTSDLLEPVLDRADLDPFATAIVLHLPDEVVDDVVASDVVLTRAIERLDLDAMLRDPGEQESLETQVEAAVVDAVREQLAEVTDTQLQDLRAGLRAAVPAMAADGSLPASSSFLDDALAQADVDPFAEAIVRHLPADVIDDIVAADQVLTRVVDDIDLAALLSELDDPDALEARVLDAVDSAVREELAEPTVAQLDDLRAGLHDAVPAMVADGSLPPSSDFLDEAIDRSDLNAVAKFAIRRLPDSLVDDTIPSDDVLDRVIDKLDLRQFLQDLDDRDALEDQIDQAVEDSVRDELTSKLTDLI